MKKYLVILIIFMVSVTSCKTSKEKIKEKNPEVQNHTTAMQISDYSVVEFNNAFAFDIYKKICANDQNRLCSPYSISGALAMTYAGAAGKTQQQMSAVLHFPENNNSFYEKYLFYNESIDLINGEETNLFSANSIWAQKDFSFKNEYFAVLDKYFKSKPYTVDFIKEPENSRKEINSWVEDKTVNKISELIKPGLISDVTRLVLVNSIYFKAPWLHQFDEKLNKTDHFYTGLNNSVLTTFMSNENNYKYYSDNDFSAIEVPYRNGKISMLLILPKKTSYFDTLKQSMGVNWYNQLLTKMTTKKVRFLIPKFKITSEFELSKELKEMGMTDAFSDAADFSLMNGKKNLKISEVVHKTFINIDEAGTEAAAATAVIMRIKSAPVDVVEFRADHPFMFIIKENSTKSILFAGNLYDPTR